MSNELIGLLAKRFIQRRDVKAVQFASGAYVPDCELKKPESHQPMGFMASHLDAHLAGRASYGHYLLDQNNECRLFAFDIDLEKSKYDPQGNLVEHTGAYLNVPTLEYMHQKYPNGPSEDEFRDETEVVACDARLTWRDRSQIAARNWYKMQMGMLARRFAKVITGDLELPCAVAYSGHKGIHVYGFTGPLPAVEVREAALLVLDIMDEWEPSRGKNFYRHKNQDPTLGYPSFSVEMFPKQDSLDGKGGYGNLMRLPLGKNLKSPEDPTFFLDLRTPVGQFMPHPDPVQLLETGNPYL